MDVPRLQVVTNGCTDVDIMRRDNLTPIAPCLSPFIQNTRKEKKEVEEREKKEK